MQRRHNVLAYDVAAQFPSDQPIVGGEAVEQGFTHIKMKVGRDLADDIGRRDQLLAADVELKSDVLGYYLLNFPNSPQEAQAFENATSLLLKHGADINKPFSYQDGPTEYGSALHFIVRDKLNTLNELSDENFKFVIEKIKFMAAHGLVLGQDALSIMGETCDKWNLKACKIYETRLLQILDILPVNLSLQTSEVFPGTAFSGSLIDRLLALGYKPNADSQAAYAFVSYLKLHEDFPKNPETLQHLFASGAQADQSTAYALMAQNSGADNTNYALPFFQLLLEKLGPKVNESYGAWKNYVLLDAVNLKSLYYAKELLEVGAEPKKEALAQAQQMQNEPMIQLIKSYMP